MEKLKWCQTCPHLGIWWTCQPADSAESVDSTIQQNITQESGKSQYPCMATRDATIKKQGFSNAVVVQIEVHLGEFIKQSEPFM